MRGCSALTPAQYKNALRHLSGRHRWRNRALLVLMVRTGLRISEALALRVDQVWDGKAVLPRLYLNRKDTKGRRAGASIVVHPEAAAALTKWIQVREPAQADARIDCAEIIAFSGSYVAILPRQPPNPITLRIKYKFARTEGNPVSLGIEQMLNSIHLRIAKSPHDETFHFTPNENIYTPASLA
jgi:integrase